MNRRQAISAGIGASAFLLSKSRGQGNDPQPYRRPFALDYAPHFGMFKHSTGGDEIDELKFAADHGFRAWEDNGMKDRPVALQSRIAETMEQQKMRMGVISATRGMKGVTFAGNDRDLRDRVVKSVAEAVESARRVNATWMTVVCGDEHPKLARDYQTANCTDLLKRCCDVVEPHDLVMVLEPLNHRTNHPGKFLVESPQAYMICKSVARDSCKILFDIYHQQISEGNLIPNIDRCWDEIGYFQCGDNPGRNEPGTGEINYCNVFGHLHRRGWTGIVGMEHGNSQPDRDGEQAVIEAYRNVDPNGRS